MSEAILALEDGFVMRGRTFGASGRALGEVCFSTNMTGYQETITDPSFKGQIVAMTYPEIGNYGVNAFDGESDVPHVSAFVVRQLSPVASSWRSQETLNSYLVRYNIPGISDIDTRALTKHLRTRGSLRGVVTNEKLSDAAAVDLAKSFSYLGTDFVQQVSTKAPYVWDEQDSQSKPYTLVQGAEEPGPDGSAPGVKLPPVRFNIVAYDFGIKRNILRRLRQNGFRVTVLPATTPASEALKHNPDGVFLSNGPGDPSELTNAHQIVRDLVGKKPIFGICLGHQIIGCALGASTFKLKFGHRGGNQPVKDLVSGKVAITSQNHGFAVDPASLPKDVALSHVNLNDGTCEGLRYQDANLFSVQYHPEAAPGPHDASYFFSQFAKNVESGKFHS